MVCAGQHVSIRKLFEKWDWVTQPHDINIRDDDLVGVGVVYVYMGCAEGGGRVDSRGYKYSQEADRGLDSGVK